MLLSDLRFSVKSTTTKTMFRFINTKQLRLRRKRRSHRNPRRKIRPSILFFEGNRPWWRRDIIISCLITRMVERECHVIQQSLQGGDSCRLQLTFLIERNGRSHRPANPNLLFLRRSTYQVYHPWSVHDMILIEKLNLKTNVVLGFFNTCNSICDGNYEAGLWILPRTWRPQLSKQLLHRNHKYNHKG